MPLVWAIWVLAIELVRLRELRQVADADGDRLQAATGLDQLSGDIRVTGAAKSDAGLAGLF